MLAPPGCGKTQILTERIRHAHAAGVAYADMLCLTFTNRAARGMGERMAQNLGGDDTSDVYVGNVHRFCSKFLFDNGIVATETSVIDEDDAISILARFMQEDEMSVAENFNRRRVYAGVFHLCGLMHQIMHSHPRELRLHPECLTAEDIAAMNAVCRVHGMTFSPQTMTDIYLRSAFYRDSLHSGGYDYGEVVAVGRLLDKMYYACQYEKYKRDNQLLDFEDLLLMSYDALVEERQTLADNRSVPSAASTAPSVGGADADGPVRYRHYPWIQVDEVQDLNALQLALIDLFAADEVHTVMYLGDEQQAIFSFMGAKLDTLSAIKSKPACQLHHLSVNHRSPRYLLDIFNTYAAEVLRIDSALLPDAGKSNDEVLMGNELKILCSEDYDQEVRDCVQFADTLNRTFPQSTTAFVVNANRDAEDISQELTRCGIGHFKVSGTDLFSQPDVKLLLAHLGVLNNEFSFMSWARLMKGVRVYESNAAARKFVRDLFDRAILPSDLLRDDDSTYLMRFVDSYANDTIVVFDTETTGLNVFEDDILQIAAVKMRNGEVVKGSEFTVYIETEREIPAMLGDIVNPIVEERKRHDLLTHEEALRQFMAYADGCTLLGHNADYDYNILDFNLRRYTPDISLHHSHPEYLDSLRLVRLLHPELREHKLKYLLEVLHLEGSNSHLADDDVNATRSVVVHCYALSKDRVGQQHDFLNDSRVRQRVETLRRNYKQMYVSALERMYSRDKSADGAEALAVVADDEKLVKPALVAELNRFYDYLLSEGMVQEIDGLRFVMDYLSGDMIDQSREPSLYEQLSNHTMEISTLKEADLCGSSNMKERIFVTTIHKAKGLEFDNVIIFDAVDGRMPNYYSRNNPRQLAEDARKFYVALSRAKHRLYVSQCITRLDYQNVPHDVHLTPFMKPIAKYFKEERFAAEKK